MKTIETKPENATEAGEVSHSSPLPCSDSIANDLMGIEIGSEFDNVAIMICTYFDGHPLKPADDEETDYGWSEWVIVQYNAVKNRMSLLISQTVQFVAIRTIAQKQPPYEHTNRTRSRRIPDRRSNCKRRGHR